MKTIILFCIVFTLQGCDKSSVTPDDDTDEISIYFPGKKSDIWDSVTMEELDWNGSAVGELYTYLSDNRTRAFILLHKGRIVMEKYWGQNIQHNSDFDQNSQGYWASAGKTLTAFLTGMAQEQGLLDIDDKISDYLGEHWTNMPLDKENKSL